METPVHWRYRRHRARREADFAAALKANASGIIMAHNHPSGTLAASQADRDITKKVKDAGRILEIPLLDHLIVTAEGHYSLADRGMLQHSSISFL